MNTFTNTNEEADRVDVAIAEYFDLVDSGETVDLESFLSQHNDVRDELGEFFEVSQDVESMAGPTLAEYSQLFASADTSELLNTQTAQLLKSRQPKDRPRLGIATQFGRYRIDGELGQGAMGSVYLAFDTQLARKVALKIPVFDEQQEPEMIARFYREARVAATLRSPHICPVYDVDMIDGIHFIAMAYIEGEPLSRGIATRDQWTSRDIAAIVKKLALALQKAHENGVIHRDLKPSNVMIDGDGEPVVMDFGLARCIDQADIRSTKDGAIVGSPAYMSPEQVMGGGDSVGPTSDIYSLGVILYEMLTGQLPFRGSVISVIGQLIGVEPTPPAERQAGVDPRLARICEEMMAKNQADRYQSMNAVAEALEMFMTGQLVGFPAPFAKPAITTAGPEFDRRLKPTTPIEAMRDDGDDQMAGSRLPLFIVGLVTAVLVLSIGLLAFMNGFDKTNTHEISHQQAVKNDNKKKTPNDSTSPLPTTPTDSPESSSSSLKYNWKTGTKYGYAIKLSATRDALTETLDGTLIYDVLSKDKESTRIAFDSRLAAHNNSRLPSTFDVDRISDSHPSFRDIVGMLPKHEFVVDRHGKIVESGCTTQLPFALGCLGQIVLETFPEAETNSWVNNDGVMIDVSKRSLRLPPSVLRHADDKETVGVNIKTNFAVRPLKSKDVVIKKDYEITSDDKQRFSAKGQGETTFDKKQGLVVQTSSTLDVIDKGQQVQVTLECRLLSDDELADRLKKYQVESTALSTTQQTTVEALTHTPDVPRELAVTSETRLEKDDELQAYRGGKWHAAKVLDVLDDGQVMIHWVGFGSELDGPVARSRLRSMPKE